MAANPGTELAALDFGNLIGGPLVAVITAQSLAANATARFIKETGFYPADQPDAADGTKLAGNPIYVDFKYPKEVEPYKPGTTYYRVSSITVDKGGSGYSSSTPPQVSISGGDTGPEGKAAELGDVKMDETNADVVKEVPVDVGGAYLTPPTVTIDAPGGTGEPAQISVVMVVDHVVSAVSAVFQEMKISVPLLTILPIPFIKVDIITIDFNAKITSTETSTDTTDTSVSGNINASYGTRYARVSFSGSVAYKKSTTSGSSVERTYSMAIHVQASQDEMPAGMEKLLGVLEGAMISRPGAVLPPATS